ncbi:kinase-like protein [Schizophyllum commune H4-8]|nr:kinase-like protein [Schizophyllum commune H4-8]KAI5899215.1 kinase-like protein [Schizophyllum commune H4-8]
MRLYLDSRIEDGGNSRVYRARVTSESPPRILAVKVVHTTKHVKNPMLRHEACAIISLRGHASVPEVYALGRTQYYEYLALEELGPNIFSPLKSSSGLTMRNLIALTCQMIDAVQHMHSRNLVHGDIKPGNFLFDLRPTGLIKIIDFGCTRPYRDPISLAHKPESRSSRFLGTRSYASIHMHYHYRPSRRDDMESLAYTVLALLCDGLPWHKRRTYDEEFLPEKCKWSGSDLAAGHPPVFGAFLDDARAMAYDAEPDYSGWKLRFRELAPGLPDEPLYDYADDGPRVGLSHWPQEMQPVDLEPAPESAADSASLSDDVWVPTSEWPNPFAILDEDLIGDEQEMVASHLERIEETPGMERPWVYQAAGYPPERIVPF